MKHLNAKSAIIVATVLGLWCLLSVSCDLAGLIAGGDPSYLASFSVDTHENPGLEADETAVISATNVYLTLPYAYAVADEAITPTVELSRGATSVSPDGTYVAKDGMTLSVAVSGKTYVYTLHLGVDPATIAFPPLIESYAVTSALNPAVPEDAVAVIYGGGVYLTLPYAVLTEEIPLTPTITVAPGFTVSPSGTYPLTDGKTLEVTNVSTSELYDYTLHIAADPATSPPLPPIESFGFLASDNRELRADCDGVIEGSNIFVTLPYATLASQAPMTPTVSLQSGFTIAPSGSYVPEDGETLLVVDSLTSVTTEYTLHLAVATSTIP